MGREQANHPACTVSVSNNCSTARMPCMASLLAAHTRRHSQPGALDMPVSQWQPVCLHMLVDIRLAVTPVWRWPRHHTRLHTPLRSCPTRPAVQACCQHKHPQPHPARPRLVQLLGSSASCQASKSCSCSIRTACHQAPQLLYSASQPSTACHTNRGTPSIAPPAGPMPACWQGCCYVSARALITGTS